MTQRSPHNVNPLTVIRLGQPKNYGAYRLCKDGKLFGWFGNKAHANRVKRSLGKAEDAEALYRIKSNTVTLHPSIQQYLEQQNAKGPWPTHARTWPTGHGPGLPAPTASKYKPW